MNSIGRYIIISILIVLSMANLTPCHANDFDVIRKDKEFSHLISQTEDSVLTSSCITICNTIIEKAKERNCVVAECYAYFKMSIYYFAVNDIDNLLKVVDECRNVKMDNECLAYLYNTWNNVVVYYINNHNYHEAVSQLEKMQKYALVNNHIYGIIQSYYGLANSYDVMGQYSKAYEKYKQAQNLEKKHGIKSTISDSLNISENAINLHKYDEAEKILLVAAKDNNHEILRVHLYSMLLTIFSLPDNIDVNKALHYKALLEKEHVDMNKLMDVSKEAYNEAYYEYYTNIAHDYVKAEKNILLYDDTLQYYLRKASNLSLQKKADQANGYYQEAISFYNEKKQKEEEVLLNNYEIKNNLDKAIENQNILKLQNAQFREKWQRIFIICGCIAFAIVITFMWVYYVIRMRNMRKSKEQAEISEKRKTLFLQNMSHEIRTPLNAIVGFTDLLTSETQGLLSPEERNMMVNLVQSNSELLGTLVNDILDVSKFESGTYHLNFSDMNVFELCGATIETVRMRVQPGVELIYQPGDKDITLHTDAQRVQQVIINYLTNACKYTSHGSITMAYEVLDDIIRFTVTDTGMGVKPEDAEEVFKRFQMLDSKVSGVGLGLHICRLIANLVHGRVYVDTSYTSGARFVFDHPLYLE